MALEPNDVHQHPLLYPGNLKEIYHHFMYKYQREYDLIDYRLNWLLKSQGLFMAFAGVAHYYYNSEKPNVKDTAFLIKFAKLASGLGLTTSVLILVTVIAAVAAMYLIKKQYKKCIHAFERDAHLEHNALNRFDIKVHVHRYTSLFGVFGAVGIPVLFIVFWTSIWMYFY